MINKIKDKAKHWLFEEKLRHDIQNVLNFTEWFSYTNEDIVFSKELLTQSLDSKINNINWLVVNFNHPYGGVFTIFRAADYLESKGYNNKIIIYDNPNFDIKSKIDSIKEYFSNLKEENFISLKNGMDDIPDSDIAIATFWTSCFYLLKLRNTRKKFYFIQDFEPGFYPPDSTYAIVEDTYRFPFHRIYNTEGLSKYIETNYENKGVKSMYFNPAVDDRYLYKPKELIYPVKVLFYGRPSTPRNGFELIISFIIKVKQKYGDKIEFYSAGENYDMDKLGLKEFKHHIKYCGIVPYKELPEFYSRFHFMISFMFTKHPSYIPFEGMATGSVIIANYNEYNTWFFKNKENSIFVSPSINLMMSEFEEVLNNPQLYLKLHKSGRETVKKYNWQDEMEKINKFIQN